MRPTDSPALFKEEQAVHGRARRWALWSFTALWLAVGAVDLAGANPFDARGEGALFIFSQWPVALALATLGHWFIASQWGPQRLHITVLPTDVFVSIAAHAGRPANIRFQTDLIESIELLSAEEWLAHLADPGEARPFTLDAAQGVEVSLRGGERMLLGTERAEALEEALRIATGEDRLFIHVRAEDLESEAAWEQLLATLRERLDSMPQGGATLRLRTGMVPHTLEIARVDESVYTARCTDDPGETMRFSGPPLAIAAHFAQAGFFMERDWTAARIHAPEPLKPIVDALRDDERTCRLPPRADGESLHLTTPLWRAEDPPITIELDGDGGLVIRYLEVDARTHAILRRHTVAADTEDLPGQVASLMASIPDEAVHFRPFQQIGLSLPL